MTNREIALKLEETAQLLELKLENAFKIKAYEKGADALRATDVEVAELIAHNEPININGIGKGLSESIKSLVQTGSFPELTALKAEIPVGVVEISAIPGLGPKKVNQLWKELNITTLDALAESCKSGELIKTKGFSAKLAGELLAQIAFFNDSKRKLTLYKAEQLAEQIERSLFIANGVFDFQRTGDLRRNLPVVSSWEWVMADTYQAVLTEKLTNAKKEIIADNQQFFWLEQEKFTCRIHFTQTERKIYKLFITSCSDVFLVPFKNDIDNSVTSEEELFKQNNLPFIPAECRDSQPIQDFTYEKLIKITDIQGTVHAHSTYSDGYHSLEQMAFACMERGFSYLGITDHSQSAGYASGLKPERIINQHEEIDRLNEKLAPFRIFKGIESDILRDGSLDYEESVLQSFEFIVASIHSQLNMNEGEATHRLIQAIKNPYTTILGHPSGRLLLKREGYPIDYKAVIQSCADYQVAIELNGNPYRMDLDWSWIKFATDLGVKFFITSDAHSKTDLDYHLTAVKVARKGLLLPEQVLNTLSAEELANYFQQKRSKI
jgi:DNA polymerase (family 10)